EKSFKFLRTYILSSPILKSANIPFELISIFTLKLTFSFVLLSKNESSFLLGVLGVLKVSTSVFFFNILSINFNEKCVFNFLIPNILVAAKCLHINMLFCLLLDR